MTEASALWLSARAGDPEAREQLAGLAGEVIGRFLRSKGVAGHDAEDLLHDAVASLMARLEKDPDPPKNLRGFLKWRGYWAFGKYVHKRVHSPVQVGGEPARDRARDDSEPWQSAHLQEVRRAIEFCRGRLGATLQEVHRLRYDQDLPSTKVAELLGISANAVRLRVFYANKKLRECLLRQGVHP